LMLANILSNPPGLAFIAMRQTMNATYQRHLPTLLAHHGGTPDS
jgi:hypothetical protein